MQRFWLPTIPQSSHPWWYWKRAERWACVSWSLLLFMFPPNNPNWISYAKQEEWNNLQYFAPLLPFTAHTTPAWQKKQTNSFSKKRLTITPSPPEQQACLRVCGTENPAAVIQLISQAEAAAPVCLVSLWILASHVRLDKCLVELPGHMGSVWVFAPERVPLGISGGGLAGSLCPQKGF